MRIFSRGNQIFHVWLLRLSYFPHFSASELNSKHCTLCFNTTNVPSPHIIATPNGSTCQDLSLEAQMYSEKDSMCISYYQLIGYTRCDCKSILPDNYLPPSDDESCDLCLDGSKPYLSSSNDTVYDSESFTTCTEAGEYLENFDSTSKSCDIFQHNGVMNCGCPFEANLFEDGPVCRLCIENDQELLEPDKHIIFEGQGLNNPTCSSLEFILAFDIYNQYGDEDDCTVIQQYFRSSCPCQSKPSKSPSGTPSARLSINPTKNIYNSSIPTIDSREPSIVPSKTQSSSPSYGSSVINNEPSIFPSKTQSSSPSDGSSVIHFEPSISPSTTQSSSPSILLSDPPTTTGKTAFPSNVETTFPPQKEMSHVPSELISNSPSIPFLFSSRPSNEPTFSHSLIPTITTSSPSDKPIISPSEKPSSNPSIIHHPSLNPSTVIDRETNCSALFYGLEPNVGNMASNTGFGFLFDLTLRTNYSDNPSLEYDSSRNEFIESFNRQVSLAAAGCNDEYNLQEYELEEKIHYVRMENISTWNSGCIGKQLDNESTEKNIHFQCEQTSSYVNITYSTPSPSLFGNDTRKLTESDVKDFVKSIVEREFQEVAGSVNGVHGASIARGEPEDVRHTDNKGRSGTNATIGIASACSSVIIIVIVLITKKKNGDDPESGMIISHNHIRSDDSISDNPTISSGRRAMMTGWEGSISDSRSNYESRSDISSRKSFTGQADDSSNSGIDFKRTSLSNVIEATYLPSSVLKDLLGTDDVEGLSIGEDNDGISIDPDEETETCTFQSTSH